MEIVKVTWLDATSPCPGMAPLEDLKTLKPVPVESVGYLLVDNIEQVSLVMSKSEEDHGCDLLIIPSGMVKSIETLEYKASVTAWFEGCLGPENHNHTQCNLVEPEGKCCATPNAFQCRCTTFKHANVGC